MKSLHAADESDSDRVLAMVAAMHAERGIPSDAEMQLAAVAPLLAGSPHGRIWLVGPRRAPVGYAAVSFGWSLAQGGAVASVDEFYIRPAVRGRGLGSEALDALVKTMREAGLHALTLDAAAGDAAVLRFCRKAGFAERTGRSRMMRALR